MQSVLGKKIIVIGSPGAGKSTFSIGLSSITGIQLHHLDRIHWLPGWIPVKQEEFDHSVRRILSGDSWIIDGNYQRTLAERFERADTVIFLDFKRYICLYRSLKRTLTSRTPRADLTEGCEERVNLEFLRWIWNYGKRDRPSTLAEINESEGKRILRFTSPGQLNIFLKNLIRSYSEEAEDREIQKQNAEEPK